MTYAPATLNELVAYWRRQGGVNLGVVGDTAHIAKGYSYHLGADHLAPDAYSARTSRDKAGLTDAASAMDLGKLDGSYPALRLFSVWLVDQARHNKPGTSDMREIIYSPDGATVLRWDRERGYQSAPQGGEADNSHLTHTHVSWYRDAEKRDHTTAFRPYFEPKGDEMTPLPITDQAPKLVTFQQPATFYKQDGSVESQGHTVAGTVTSPFQASNGNNHFRAVYAGPAPVRLILIKPATINPAPAADCSAVEAELADLNDRVDTAVKILEGG